MNKHFLVTVSNDFENLTGVEFVCSFFKQHSEHQITLLHICRLDSRIAKNTLLETWKNPDDRVKGKLTVGARRAMDKAISLLSESSMSVDEMITKTFDERYGKVKDILKEGSSGLYDAIILGKRASYTLQWFFERPADETAKAIITDSSISTPIWICPAPEKGRKNVLVCVDGSDESYRAVDHTGYILSKQDQHNLTLLHVENGAGLDSEAIFEKSQKLLEQHSIDPSRIHRENTWAINVAATIVSFAEKGGFAAIAVGLKGVDKGIMKRINLAGGTTASLVERTEKISLWICP
jgi:hypothetical protein